MTRDSGLGSVAFSAISLDWTALAFTLGVTLVVGLLFGLVPAIGATRASLTDALKDGRAKSRAAAADRCDAHSWWSRSRWRSCLLAGSGLMLQESLEAPRRRCGIRRDERAHDEHEHSGRGQRARFDAGLLRAALGSRARRARRDEASMTNCPPLSGRCSSTIIWFDGHAPDNPSLSPTIGLNWVSPTWFATVKVPLRRGRVFTTADRLGAPVVAVVNDIAAKKFWPGENPIGKHIGAGMGGMKDAEVIGVVGSVRLRADSAPKPDVYISYLQFPRGGTILFVRATRNPAAITADVRRAIHQAAPQYPIFNVKTMAERTAAATAQSRFSAALLGLFALTALSLASIGIYGVMALAVSARTREIGVRIALGADRAARPAARRRRGRRARRGGRDARHRWCAAASTRVLRSMLFDLTPTDPPTYVAIVAVLGACALAASWLPARRASRVDPVIALRAD